LGLALAGAALAVPVAIRLAQRFDLLDRPVGWKTHGRATPYLGGAALVAGFLVGCLALAGWRASHVVALLGGALVLCAVGTVDDRRGLTARTRILAVAGVAVAAHASGIGWSFAPDYPLNLAATILFTLGVVNAFNILDLMDGIAAGACAVGSAGVGVLALLLDASAPAIAAAGLCGASAGFLLYNLRAPAAIFLGDGGSMAIGFLLAGLVMSLPLEPEVGSASLLAGVLLVGLPVFDMAFRIYSRIRRGVSLMTAGHDSTANWLATRLGSARAVTAALVFGQAALSAAAAWAVFRGQASVLALALACIGVGAVLIGLLERSGFGRSPADRSRQARADATRVGS
jgi:UDP-GlcNAc:undecaprenyl-phosphate GlcNAc-1-phosphate transferase